MKENITSNTRCAMPPWRTAVLGLALVAGTMVPAQELFNEDFAGGASTAGFTIEQTAGTCTWTYNNPGERDITGGGFDTDFAIFDSDFCGNGSGASEAYLVSPPFDASGPGNYILSFSHQYRDIANTVANVEVWDGTNWNEVYSVNGSNAGYPNPAVSESFNITDATGGSTSAQVRFHYSGNWRWWWALDNINLSVVACAAPSDLAVADVTTSGGSISWTDNGSAGYEWAVTAGGIPDGTNEVASGDGGNLAITGLNSGTPYTAWVRADCGDGTFSNWSNGFPFTTGISNDDCSGAIALTVNEDDNCAATTSGTVAGATASGLTSTCGGTADDDVWFSFTATGDSHIISLQNVSGSTTDMYMALWTGDCGSLEQVPGTCSDPNSMLVTGLAAGTTYYLQVYTWTSAPGQTSAFQVCVGTPPPPPANDDCHGAVALTVNPNYNCGVVTPGTVASATPSGITSTCGGTADDDVWFTFTATDTLHRISLENITGSTSDMYMALWTGDCSNLALVPNSCSDPQTMNIGGLTIGTTYYLQVYTWTSTTGQTSAFDVCVGTEPFCQPPLDITLDSFEAPDATVSFTENTAPEYEYELRESGDAGSGTTGLLEGGIVPGSPLTFTGLEADTQYMLYIRSICSPGDTSAWSEGLSLFDGYCNTIDFTLDIEPICNVTFAGLNHDSDPTVNGSPAWEDFTAFSAFVELGGSYPISVTGNTAGSFTNYITAFFDWDGDQVFETAVEVGSFASTVCTETATATVNVPTDAVVGTTRMRVVKNFNTSPLDACGTYSFGQAEDYSVEVGTVGVAHNAATDGFSVHPNPASTELFLQTPDGQPVHVKAYDMVGKLVFEQDRTTRLDVARLAPGSYQLMITDVQGNIQARTRFVKQ